MKKKLITMFLCMTLAMGNVSVVYAEENTALSEVVYDEEAKTEAEQEEVTEEAETEAEQEEVTVEAETETEQEEVAGETEAETETEQSEISEETMEFQSEVTVSKEAMDIAVNDSFSTAESIETDAEVIDFLSSNEDVNFYKFELEEDGNFNIAFNNDAEEINNLWKIQLYDSNKNLLVSHTFFSGTTGGENTSTIGVPSGEYYIKVSTNLTQWDSAQYYLTVNYEASEVWEKENNDDMYNADSLSADTTYYGSMKSYDDEDFYALTLDKTGYIDLEFGKGYDVDSNNAWNVLLYNQDMVEIMKRSVSTENTETEELGKIGLNPGTYYLKIICPGDINVYWSQANYSLKWNFQESDAWETELNDTLVDSEDVKVGTVVNGSLSDSEDVDYYKFTIEKDGNISFSLGKEFDGADNGWKVEAYNESQQKLFNKEFYTGNTNVEKSYSVGIPAGTYYVKVDTSVTDWTSVSYNLTVNYEESDVWETEINDSVDGADSVVTGNTYYGSLASNTDMDYYKFSLEKSGTITLSFGKENINDSNRTWYATIYDENQQEVYSKTYFGGNSTVETSGKIGLPKGDYYVKIDSNASSSSTATYNFKLTYAASTAWETEINDTTETADTLPIGVIRYGSLKDRKDTDYYKFNVNKTSYISLYFGRNYEKDAKKYWKVSVYDSNMVEKKNYTFYAGAQKAETTAKIKLTAGNYYIKVHTYDFINGYCSSVNYYLRINQYFTNIVIKPTVTNLATGVKITWNRVSNADGYRIYRKAASGDYVLVKTIKSNTTVSYTDTSAKVTNGTKYTYKVVAYKGTLTSDFMTKSICRLNRPIITSLKNTSGKKMYVKWGKNNSATGYQVKYVTGSTTKTKTYIGKAGVSKTISGLTKGKTYKVYVRTYKTISGTKYYSAWSPVKSVKISK